MDNQSGTIRLYSVQDKKLVKVIQRDGCCFSKKEYIERKYGESSKIFISAYEWFAKEALKYVPKPGGAELHYWAFINEMDIEPSSGSSVLIMDVPVDECVLFNLYDWNKILKLQYIGDNEQDENAFREHIRNMGIKHDSDIILTNFYPDLKMEIENSWQRLFKHHQQLIQGVHCITSIEAALWQIKNVWITDIINC